MEINKKLPKFLVACCVSCSISYPAAAQQATALQPYIFQIDVSGVASINNNSWSVAGNSAGTSPNILSELKWKEQTGLGTKLSVSSSPFKHWSLNIAYQKTGTINGSATDKDYKADNRTEITYEGNFSAAKGYLQDWYTGIGYTFLCNSELICTVQLGYNNSNQLNYLLPADASTPADLSSTYKNTWKGIVIGGIADLPLGRITVSPGLQYRQLTYYAAGNWNLIQTFQHPLSFEHNAKGFSINPSLRVRYSITKNIGWFTSLNYEYFETGHGAETLYLRENGTANTRLNAAYRNGWSLQAGISVKSNK
ncbi:hypothetical protein DVR12_13900 [Chitinophaga silvatica]|uniref:Protochlamydia outer membrane protein domain-containing protein n=1 Tax=Chitinophaga silvatica TaxID=2282649 RepID=A0A3E1Y8N5_9BACT|nr:hypothetical protein [Chitinophaga silvatica]RFS21750.1 hypothetical protein DVR12_13900 [Chitinophaga silvatica]